MHDLSLDQFAELTVYANGGGTNVNIDCHRAGEPKAGRGGGSCGRHRWVSKVGPCEDGRELVLGGWGTRCGGEERGVGSRQALPPRPTSAPPRSSALAGSHSNLFSNINFGAGTRPFASGGAGGRGAHSGANNTFWNLYASRQLALPDCSYGPMLTFVGNFGAVKGARPQRLRASC